MLATQDVQVSAEGEALGAELTQVLHEVDLKLLHAAQLAARLAATQYYDEQGYASSVDWIRLNCHQTSNAAADLIAVGKNLHRVPESAQALKQGEIGYSHLKALVRTAMAVGNKFDESLLLAKARESSAGKFYYLCKQYRHAADREGFEAERAELVENRQLFISTCEDGTVLLSGTFDPEGGAAILTTLKPLARKSGAHDNRGRQKRYGDALVELASGGGSQAQIQVTTSLETLRGLPGAAAADLELSSLPISAKTIERLACDAAITRIVLGSESMVIDVGRSKRVVSEPGRRAPVAVPTTSSSPTIQVRRSKQTWRTTGQPSVLPQPTPVTSRSTRLFPGSFTPIARGASTPTSTGKGSSTSPSRPRVWPGI